MRFAATPLSGAYVLSMDPVEDERGSFERAFCSREFADLGLNPNIAQVNVSFNRVRGILRGMHFQARPSPEAKVVRCTRGAVWDVIIDLRPASSTCRKWFGVELSEENRQSIYVPEGFAHGFQTLRDRSEVLYLMSEHYRPELARGVRWDDPAFGIGWPIPDPLLSERDRSHPLLAD